MLSSLLTGTNIFPIYFKPIIFLSSMSNFISESMSSRVRIRRNFFEVISCSYGSRMLQKIGSLSNTLDKSCESLRWQDVSVGLQHCHQTGSEVSSANGEVLLNVKS